MRKISDFWSMLLRELIGFLKTAFVMGLKLDLFHKEIYSRSCETLQDNMDELRAELSTYRDILEITDRVKMADVKK